MVQRVGEVSSAISWASPGQIRSSAMSVIARKTRGMGE